MIFILSRETVVNIFSIFDCCHSGTIFDLNKNKRTNPNIRHYNVSACHDSEEAFLLYEESRFGKQIAIGSVLTNFCKNILKNDVNCRELEYYLQKQNKQNNHGKSVGIQHIVCSSINYDRNKKIFDYINASPRTMESSLMEKVYCSKCKVNQGHIWHIFFNLICYFCNITPKQFSESSKSIIIGFAKSIKNQFHK